MTDSVDTPKIAFISSDERWMEEALALAECAANIGEVPVGAVVVLNDEIIGRGWNQVISGNDPTAHAEVVALRDAAQRLNNYRLVGASLYVTIEPCSMCAGAIVHSRVERVVFGTTEPKAGAVVSQNTFFDQPFLNHCVSWQGGVLADRCSERISRFFRERRASQKAARKALKQDSDPA